MSFDPLIQGGIGVFSIGAIIWVVQAFLKRLREKEDAEKEERQAFLTVISNHMEHTTQALEQVKDATQESTKVSQHLYEYLIKVNGNKK